jgi:hypothetical protein
VNGLPPRGRGDAFTNQLCAGTSTVAQSAIDVPAPLARVASSWDNGASTKRPRAHEDSDVSRRTGARQQETRS